MRELTDHQVNPVNEGLRVFAGDSGVGGAPKNYQVVKATPGIEREPIITEIVFHAGELDATGVNGLTHEVLLAIIVDRLRAFQKGPYACRENALALTKIEEAQHWLLHRTTGRMDRGVEGTHKT